MIRILNVFAWCVIEDEQVDFKVGSKISISPYVQGMNVLVAPLAYVCRSEPQAFALLYRLLMVEMPRYITPTLAGVMDGVRLVDLVLKTVDRRLYEYLDQSMANAKIYALPSVLTLCACTPPLEEVLKLWDFLFSFGIHMNVVLIVAQLLLIRGELMNTKNPMALLRNFPQLESSKIIKLSLSIARNIPDSLYDLIVRHTFDESVTLEIDDYKI